MIAFPVATFLNMTRNNTGAQTSFFLNLSGNLFNASMQLGELNLQAGRKLMEESADALKKAMQLRTPVDTQLFIAEQTQATVARMQGYAMNVQKIAADSLITLGMPAVAGAAAQPAPARSANEESAAKDSVPHGQHDADPHPSPLVEKLITSAVNDVDKLH